MNSEAKTKVYIIKHEEREVAISTNHDRMLEYLSGLVADAQEYELTFKTVFMTNEELSRAVFRLKSGKYGLMFDGLLADDQGLNCVLDKNVFVLNEHR